jgi:hypothetical protein
MSLTLSRLTRGRVLAPNGASYVTLGSQPLGSPIPTSGVIPSGELGLCELSQEAGSYLPLLKKGVWQRLTGNSLATKGFSSESFKLLNPDCLPGIFQTEHGPLTKGFGDASLAGPEDVTVLVEGAPRQVSFVEPTLGIIVLAQSVQPGSLVEVSYYYTKNPIIPLTEWNNFGFAFNKVGSTSSYAGPYPFTNVFGPPPTTPQPLEVGWTFTAFDAKYTGVFNDFTGMLFNEPSNAPTLPALDRQIDDFRLSYEGLVDPTTQGWLRSGLNPGLVFEEGLFVVEDSSTDPVLDDSEGLVYTYPADFSFKHLVQLSFRSKVFSYTPKGNLVSVAAGWAGNQDLTCLAFLESDGFNFLGLLGPEGDETSWESYKGVTLTQSPRNTLGVVYYDRAVLDQEPGYLPGDVLYYLGQTNTVREVNILLDGTFEILFDLEFDPTLVSWETFKTLNPQTLTTYRVLRSETGKVEVFVGGNPSPIISYAGDLPQQEEVYNLIPSNAFFFGSLSQQGLSKSGWDFFRANILPLETTQAASRLERSTSFEVLPSVDPHTSWELIGDQGSQFILNDDVLSLKHVGRTSEGTLSYGRVEPLLTYESKVDLEATFRLDSFVPGTFPGFLTIADREREVTLALFTYPVLTSGIDYATFRASQGFFEQDAASLATQGLLSVGGTNPNAFLFTKSYSGTRSYNDEGWDTSNLDNLTLTFEDHGARWSKGSGVLAEVSSDVAIVNPLNVFDRYLFQTQFKVNSTDLSSVGRIPLVWGMDDLEIEVFISLMDTSTFTGLVVTNQQGAILADLLGDPRGWAFDWNDGDFHSYKVIRELDVISYFGDDRFLGSLDISELPSSNGNQFRFDWHYKNEAIDLTLDYKVFHSTAYTARQLGLYRGGDYFDESSYDFVPLEFLGNEVTLRVVRDPAGSTQVFSDTGSPALFDLQYSELPFKTRPKELNTDLGFVRFGSLDPISFAHQIWDELRYVIKNERFRQASLPHSTFNDVWVATSAEPVYDETLDVIEVQSDTEDSIFLGTKAYAARKVVSVSSLDGALTYDFTFDEKTQVIRIDNLLAPLNRTPFKVTLLATGPFSMDYLLNQEPVLKLNSGTPPYEMSQAKEVTIEEVNASQFDDLGALFGSNVDFSSSDGRIRVVFKDAPQDDLYHSLELRGSILQGSPETTLAPACDCDGFGTLNLEGYLDAYVIPAVSPDGFGQYEVGFHFDRLPHTFDSINHVFEPTSHTDVEASLSDVRLEVYPGASDEVQTEAPLSVMTTLEGYVFDSTGYAFDQVNNTFDDYSTTDTVIDYTMTFNFP